MKDIFRRCVKKKQIIAIECERKSKFKGMDELSYAGLQLYEMLLLRTPTAVVRGGSRAIVLQ